MGSVYTAKHHLAFYTIVDQTVWFKLLITNLGVIHFLFIRLLFFDIILWGVDAVWDLRRWRFRGVGLFRRSALSSLVYLFGWHV